jgi:hypothetical protein
MTIHVILSDKDDGLEDKEDEYFHDDDVLKDDEFHDGTDVHNDDADD